MNRRDFIRTAGAATLVPVLPLPAIAGSAAGTAATTPANAFQVGWAAFYARANNCATPELIQKWLRIGPEQAHQIMADLVAQNVIKAPVSGAAVVVKPMYPNGAIPNVFKKAKSVVDLANDTLDSLLEQNAADPEQDIIVSPPVSTSDQVTEALHPPERYE